MSLESENRQEREEYQKFEHNPIDLLTTVRVPGGSVPNPTDGNDKGSISARIYCPDVRVISRVTVVFTPNDPNDRSKYDLSALPNTIVAYKCCNVRSLVARVGEIVGKHGVPLQFPKSRIDGIAFETESDMPWIDLDLSLGNPGVAGKWMLSYHATSNNKLKYDEWQGYITRVNMSLQGTAPILHFGDVVANVA
jgi:hypothetical protein